MAHVVTQRARCRAGKQAMRAAALLALAALLGAAAPAARAAGAGLDEMVPGGTFLLRVEVSQETQRDAIATDGRRHPLEDYLVNTPGVNRQLSGDVVRFVTDTETHIGLGISDTWNLDLTVPYLVVRQQSTLSARTTDTAAVDAADLLQSETVNGVGNVRLMSLHRPLFSDTTSIILGWGISGPGGPQQNDYVGRTTLSTRVPYNTFGGSAQITGYPISVDHARIDLRITFDLGFDTYVKTPDASHVRLHPPNVGTIALSWEQEFQALGYGVYLKHTATTPSFLDGSDQQDMVKEIRLGAELTFGNLRELEAHPLAFPYQMGLQLDHAVEAFNAPESSRATFFLRSYF